jgi:hypothetical protein
MSLERFLNEPVSEIGFSHNYTKPSLNSGTTIRMGLKDSKNYVRKAGDIVWLYHSNLRFKVRIVRIERKPIKAIPLQVLKDDCHPFPCDSHSDFVKGMSRFYDFKFDESKVVYVIYWERVL